MNRNTITFLSLTILLSFFFTPIQLVAQSNPGLLPPQAPPAPGATGPAPLTAPPNIAESAPSVLVATVNIKNSMILSQDKGTIDIGFSISNRIGVQTGVRYGVKLIADGPKGQVIVDEYVYDDAVTLLENDIVHKRISYTAPVFLSGTYQLYLTSSNQSGFPFGSTLVDTIELTATKKGVLIDPHSCTTLATGDTTATPITQVAVIEATQGIRLTCSATHNGEGQLPTVASFEIQDTSIYGQKLPPAPEGAETATFAPGETKTFSIILPRQTKPGAYYTKMTLLAGPIVSNPIIIRSVVKGKVAIIENVSFDKEAYKKGDVAHLALLWHGTNDTPDISKPSPYLLQAVMRSESGRECAEQFSQEVTMAAKQPIEVALAIDANCINPVVSVSISDTEKNTVYDTKEFAIKVEKTPINSNTAIFVVLGILVLGILAFAIRHRSKRHPDKTINSSMPTAVLFIFIFLGSMVFTSSAHADTFQGYAINGGGDIIRSTVNLDKGTYPPYTPGETIRATAEMTLIPANPWNTAWYKVRMEVLHDNANTRGNYYGWPPLPQIIPNPSNGWSMNLYPNQSTGIHTYSGFTAWPLSTPGPYSVQFRASFEEYQSWWWAGDPYDIYYSVEEIPPNRVNIFGDQYGVTVTSGYPMFTFRAEKIGNFSLYPTMTGWGKISPNNWYNQVNLYPNSGDPREVTAQIQPLPYTVAGTYLIRFTAMDDTGVWRNDYANLYLTSQAQSLPDLRPADCCAPSYYGYMNGHGYFPTGSNPSAYNGGSVATGGQFYVFYQTSSSPNGTGTITDHPPILANALSPGQSWMSLSYDTSEFPRDPGTYSMRYCVDKSESGNSGQITEYNENDNCTAWGTATVTEVACSDLVDNDGDNLSDEDDPGCISLVYNPADYSENDPTECSDGVDNGDTEDVLIDEDDPGCFTDGYYDAEDDDEYNVSGPVYECSDSLDNADVEDVLVDINDPGCHTDNNASNPASYDGADNDESDRKKPIFIDF